MAVTLAQAAFSLYGGSSANFARKRGRRGKKGGAKAAIVGRTRAGRIARVAGLGLAAAAATRYGGRGIRGAMNARRGGQGIGRSVGYGANRAASGVVRDVRAIPGVIDRNVGAGMGAVRGATVGARVVGGAGAQAGRAMGARRMSATAARGLRRNIGNAIAGG